MLDKIVLDKIFKICHILGIIEIRTCTLQFHTCISILYLFFVFSDSGGRNSRGRKGQNERPSTANGKLINSRNNNKGGQESSANNSRSSSLYGGGRFPGLVPGAIAASNKGRGRNFSGDSSDIYPFHLDGPPSYGEIVPEPQFVTPIIGGMTYFYDGQYAPTSGIALNDEVLKANIKTQM